MDAESGFHKGNNPENMGRNLGQFLDQPQFLPATISEMRENGDFRIMTFAIDAADSAATNRGEGMSAIKEAMVMALPMEIRTQFEGEIAPAIREHHEMARAKKEPEELRAAVDVISQAAAEYLVKEVNTVLDQQTDEVKGAEEFKATENALAALKSATTETPMTALVLDDCREALIAKLKTLDPEAALIIENGMKTNGLEVRSEQIAIELQNVLGVPSDVSNFLVGKLEYLDQLKGAAFYSDDFRDHARTEATAIAMAIDNNRDQLHDRFLNQVYDTAQQLLSITGVRSFKDSEIGADHYLGEARTIARTLSTADTEDIMSSTKLWI